MWLLTERCTLQALHEQQCLHTCRGYPINYLPFVANTIEEKLEATTCESLIIERGILLAGARRLPEGMLEGEPADQLLCS